MKITLLIVTLILLTGCSNQWKSNEEYLDYLSSLVIKYQANHGEVPRLYDEAIRESKVMLPNRGDINGRGLMYFAFSSNIFMFRAYGENSQNDRGLLDDLDVYYINKRKVDRKTFIAELKKLEFYNEVYRDFFER